ncbi:MAG: phenylacetate--CoA ligase [Deltaproteobacteria bacterium]|nr:phenylacetate--CoA ligase [Deltaproteobacteria bacterium]
MNLESISFLQAQLERLHQIPFYNQKAEQAGVDLSTVRNLEDFQNIPFTKTNEILAELQKKTSESSLYSDDVTRINFSPSGQELYPVYHTNNDLKNMHRVCARSLEAAGVKKEDICAVTFGYQLFVAGLFYQGQLEDYGAKVIPLGPGESERVVKLINDYQASVLISNPTFAMKLAQKGIPSVKTLFVGGEPFTSVAGYREKVLDAFERDLVIIDSYSMALCLPIARSCRHSPGLHVMDDFVYAEVIDPETGKVVSPGEKGELVLTHLKKEAAPLLRYRTGDLTFMEEKACACGRRWTLPKSVFGRTDEMLKIKGVKFWPSQMAGIMKEFPEFHNGYRVVVSEKKGVDVLALHLVGNPDAKNRIDRLKERLKQETLLAFNDILITDKLEKGPLVVDQRKGRTF